MGICGNMSNDMDIYEKKQAPDISEACLELFCCRNRFSFLKLRFHLL